MKRALVVVVVGVGVSFAEELLVPGRLCVGGWGEYTAEVDMSWGGEEERRGRGRAVLGRRQRTRCINGVDFWGK